MDVPDQPDFGEPLPLKASPETLAFLARRRSASALTLREPAPSPEELDILLRLAARVPDHGKLAPWRFVVMAGEAKARLADGLRRIAATRPDAAKANAALGKFAVPPLAVLVTSKIMPGDIPAWEQQLSAGAVCMTLVNAASAMGYGANWITDWYAYDPEAAALFGLAANERVAGFVYLGTPIEPPQERIRPGLTAIVTRP
jgi:nitroreductase